MTQVAALYVDPRGPYPKMGDWHAPASPNNPRVDCWTIERDARLYQGPWPVVCHPPRKHWSRLRHLAKVVCRNPYCKMEMRAGAVAEDGSCPYCETIGETVDWGDRDCAPRAAEQVRKFGGVLEHPAGSKLWEHCGLPAPFCDDTCRARNKTPAGGCVQQITSSGLWSYTIEIDQVEWGHVARKRTWLYLVGVPREALETPPFPGRQPTHYASGGRTKSSRNGGAVPAGIKVCSTQQRMRTPPLLAEYLVRLARAAGAARSTHSRNDWRWDEPARAGREERK
jgi:hypothetical protein